MVDEASQALAGYASNPETAKAVSEFVGSLFGGPIKNAVGLLGGDWIYYARLENLAALHAGVMRRLKERGIEQFAPLPLSLAIPLVKAAADEHRPELAEIWEALIANAMDPKRRDAVRKNFVDIVSALEPLDALLLKEAEPFQTAFPQPGQKRSAIIAITLNARVDAVDVALGNLHSLGLIEIGQTPTMNSGGPVETFKLTALWREFKRAIEA